MDILCSRRGNIVRRQSGLGLPVRDLFQPDGRFSDEVRNEYWTSLPYVGDNNVQQQIQYRELRKLGAFNPLDRLGRAEHFRWLWRSTINQYDDHVRIWQKWLVFMLRNWRVWPPPTASRARTWPDGFAEYDVYLKLDLARGFLESMCFLLRVP